MNVRMFNGDLQESCLRVLLTAPVIFIPELLVEASISLQVYYYYNMLLLLLTLLIGKSFKY